MQYKKAFVIPAGAIVPGPKKPWDIYLFMFPSLSHITTLQCEGLTIDNASLGTLVCSVCSEWSVTVAFLDVACIVTCQVGIAQVTVTTIQP